MANTKVLRWLGLRSGWWKVGVNGRKGREGGRSEGFLFSTERRKEESLNPRPTESLFKKKKASPKIV